MAQEKQVAMPGNRGKKVVEVVRHAARELTDRLHLLALHELRLERLELGRVRQRRHQPRPALVERPRQRHLKEDVLVAAMQAQHLGPVGAVPYAEGAKHPWSFKAMIENTEHQTGIVVLVIAFLVARGGLFNS